MLVTLPMVVVCLIKLLSVRFCKPLTDFEVNSIVCFRAAFERSVEEVRKALAECDNWVPLWSLHKIYSSVIDLKGHPNVCYTVQ